MPRLRRIGRALSGFALAMAACAAPPTPELLRCDEGDLELSETFGERWSAPSECTSDADCVLHLPEVRCPDVDVEYTWCELAVHRDDVGALDATLGDVLAEVCPRIEPSCRGGALCMRSVARCQDARCVAVSERPACVERCSECLTRDSCEGHCGAHLECILAAETCDAVRTCTSGPIPPDAG